MGSGMGPYCWRTCTESPRLLIAVNCHKARAYRAGLRVESLPKLPPEVPSCRVSAPGPLVSLFAALKGTNTSWVCHWSCNRPQEVAHRARTQGSCRRRPTRPWPGRTPERARAPAVRGQGHSGTQNRLPGSLNTVSPRNVPRPGRFLDPPWWKAVVARGVCNGYKRDGGNSDWSTVEACVRAGHIPYCGALPHACLGGLAARAPEWSGSLRPGSFAPCILTEFLDPLPLPPRPLPRSPPPPSACPAHGAQHIFDRKISSFSNRNGVGP